MTLHRESGLQQGRSVYDTGDVLHVPVGKAALGRLLNTFGMNSISWFALVSTVVAAVAIMLGTMWPALAMGRAISRALDALARQAEAEGAICAGERAVSERLSGGARRSG